MSHPCLSKSFLRQQALEWGAEVEEFQDALCDDNQDSLRDGHDGLCDDNHAGYSLPIAFWRALMLYVFATSGRRNFPE